MPASLNVKSQFKKSKKIQNLNNLPAGCGIVALGWLTGHQPDLF